MGSARFARSLAIWNPLAIVVVSCGLVLLGASAAHAHGKSVSYSTWTLSESDEDVHEVSVRISRLELTRLGLGTQEDPESIREVSDYIVDHIGMRAGGIACVPVAPPQPQRAREGWLSFAFALRCPDRADLVIKSAILLSAAPSHLHFARLRNATTNDPRGSASKIREKVLSRSDPRWVVQTRGSAGASNPEPPSGSTLRNYVALGIEHILSGWDHLAFVIALLLLAGSLAEVARLVTGFTLAHSVTLGLAVLGVLHPDPPAVEAVIGFSVALVALENSWELAGRDRRVPIGLALLLLTLLGLSLADQGALSSLSLVGLLIFSLCHFALLDSVPNPARVRIALAFCFGLVHGFGFAGVLEEVSLPTARLVPALFGFNIGVEIGQLGVICLAWPALRFMARLGEGRGHRIFAEMTSAGICGIGLYWFMLRTLG